MRLAITGAGGFLGQYLVRACLARNLKPVLATRSSASLPDWMAGCPLVSMDVHEPGDDPFAGLGYPEVLIHLAWGRLDDFSEVSHLDEILPAHERFLKGLVEAGLPSLVVSGTCLEYGRKEGCLSESSPAEPVLSYAEAKLELQRRLQGLQEQFGFNFTWARIFYVYGDGQNESSLWPQLRAYVKRGAPRFPMSMGNQVRDFIHATDVAESLLNLALTGGNAGIVNVCSGRPRSVLAQVNEWIEQHGWRIEPDPGRYSMPPYEPLAFWGNREKLDAL